MDTPPPLPWFSRVFSLDGILPVFVFLLPKGIPWILDILDLPGRDDLCHVSRLA